MDAKAVNVYYHYDEDTDILLGTNMKVNVPDESADHGGLYSSGEGYYKYNDGTLICFGTLTFTSTQVVNVYLPVAYNNLYFKIEYTSSNKYTYNTTVNNTGRFAIGLYNFSGTPNTDYVAWKTTGTWK